jgi:thioredoxin-related protein
MRISLLIFLVLLLNVNAFAQSKEFKKAKQIRYTEPNKSISISKKYSL